MKTPQALRKVNPRVLALGAAAVLAAIVLLRRGSGGASDVGQLTDPTLTPTPDTTGGDTGGGGGTVDLSPLAGALGDITGTLQAQSGALADISAAIADLDTGAGDVTLPGSPDLYGGYETAPYPDYGNAAGATLEAPATPAAPTTPTKPPKRKPPKRKPQEHHAVQPKKKPRAHPARGHGGQGPRSAPGNALVAQAHTQPKKRKKKHRVKGKSPWVAIVGPR